MAEERKRIEQERQQVRVERTQMASERDAWTAERDRLQHATLTSAKDNYVTKSDDVTSQLLRSSSVLTTATPHTASNWASSTCKRWCRWKL